MSKPRAADDFAEIRKHMGRIRADKQEAAGADAWLIAQAGAKPLGKAPVPLPSGGPTCPQCESMGGCMGIC